MRSNVTIRDPYVYCDISILFLLLNIGVFPKLKFQWVPDHNFSNRQHARWYGGIIEPRGIYFYPFLIYCLLFFLYQFTECINTDFLYQEFNSRFVPAGSFTVTVKHT